MFRHKNTDELPATARMSSLLTKCAGIGSLLMVSTAHAFVAPQQSVHKSTIPLFAQSKPQRFSQQAHVKSKRKRRSGAAADGRKDSKPVQSRQSGKSIEELERILSNKWKTEYISGPDELDGEADGDSATSHNGLALRRPVFDPWAEKQSPSVPRKQKEYYGVDDDGYEFIIEDEDDLPEGDIVLPGQTKKINVARLVSRKSEADNDAKVTKKEGGFFFNPDAATNEDDESKQNSGRHDSNSSTTNENKKTKKLAASPVEEFAEDQTEKISGRRKRESRPEGLPVLDEEGNIMLLTLEEAVRQFQKTASTRDEESTQADAVDVSSVIENPPIMESTAGSWEDLGISNEHLLANLDDMGCPMPLMVQGKACPEIISSNDVIIGTYTGSGKTLAFLAPLVQKMLESESPSSLGLKVIVVAPGRELASQIVAVARELIAETGLRVQLAIGGTTFTRNLEQIRKRKPHILVGTPGRIAELVVGRPGDKGGRLKTASLETLVMDEFDALLEYKPHRDPTRAVMSTLKRRNPENMQSILCSATAADVYSNEDVIDFLRPGFKLALADDDDHLVTKTANEGEKGAPRVSKTVIHGVVHVPHKRYALDTVKKILFTEPAPQQILIFVENARRVDIVVEKLAKNNILAAPLHGGQGSSKMDRAEVSQALREGYVGIVVATELAARGLDAPLLTHVINLDLPTDSSHYAHRAGRCGRGGRPGVVINLTTNGMERNVPKRLTDKLGIELHTVEPRNGLLNVVLPESII